jgi:hypothetical protein
MVAEKPDKGTLEAQQERGKRREKRGKMES